MRGAHLKLTVAIPNANVLGKRFNHDHCEVITTIKDIAQSKEI